jgi:hypothetical protein
VRNSNKRQLTQNLVTGINHGRISYVKGIPGLSFPRRVPGFRPLSCGLLVTAGSAKLGRPRDPAVISGVQP